MPKRILPLTDIQVKNAKPKEKEYKISDGGGLYLLITPSGGKLWRFKYRFGGMETGDPIQYVDIILWRYATLTASA
jgi:hypothetical protein